MIGRNEQSLKYVKKLDKLISILNEETYMARIKIDLKESLLLKYSFYLLIFKTINKIENSFFNNNYRHKFKNQIDSENEIVTNICVLNRSDTLAINFSKLIKENILIIITNDKFQPVNYVTLFFYLFNQISNLTKNFTTDTNIKK
jgi:hypothetical protein